MGPGLYAIMVIAGIGTGAYFLFPFAMMPEIVDLDELRTGKRREGAYFGIFFFVQKTSVALAPFIAGHVLAHTGYVPDVPQAEAALGGIRMLVGIIPMVLFVFGLLLLIVMPLNKQQY
jgi:GPH family glycoside/pentoside/hexuronide:cation symporter